MTFTTKYEIGQELYFLLYNAIQCEKVRSIRVSSFCNQWKGDEVTTTTISDPVYNFTVFDGEEYVKVDMPEYRVFATVEELWEDQKKQFIESRTEL